MFFIKRIIILEINIKKFQATANNMELVSSLSIQIKRQQIEISTFLLSEGTNSFCHLRYQLLVTNSLTSEALSPFNIFVTPYTSPFPL